MRREILEFSASNMAGYAWSWSFFVNRTVDGRFTISAKQSAAEGGTQTIPAHRGLRDGNEVYEALISITSDAGYDMRVGDLGHIANIIGEIDPKVAGDLLSARATRDETATRESEERLAERRRKLVPFRRTIDVYVERFSDTRIRRPGTSSTWGTTRGWAHGFLENYVLQHNALPTGRHQVGYGSGRLEHDFTDIAAFHRENGYAAVP